MMKVIRVAIVLLLLIPALAQAQSHGTKEEKTKDEIQKLFRQI